MLSGVDGGFGCPSQPFLACAGFFSDSVTLLRRVRVLRLRVLRGCLSHDGPLLDGWLASFPPPFPKKLHFGALGAPFGACYLAGEGPSCGSAAPWRSLCRLLLAAALTFCWAGGVSGRRLIHFSSCDAGSGCHAMLCRGGGGFGCRLSLYGASDVGYGPRLLPCGAGGGFGRPPALSSSGSVGFAPPPTFYCARNGCSAAAAQRSSARVAAFAAARCSSARAAALAAARCPSPVLTAAGALRPRVLRGRLSHDGSSLDGLPASFPPPFPKLHFGAWGALLGAGDLAGDGPPGVAVVRWRFGFGVLAATCSAWHVLGFAAAASSAAAGGFSQGLHLLAS